MRPSASARRASMMRMRSPRLLRSVLLAAFALAVAVALATRSNGDVDDGDGLDPDVSMAVGGGLLADFSGGGFYVCALASAGRAASRARRARRASRLAGGA